MSRPQSRSRVVAGLVGGAMLVASSAAHSLLGWRPQRELLEKQQAPADLVAGLAIGWHFAGAAMLMLGLLLLSIFLDAWRGRPVSRRPALYVAVLYVLYGIGAWYSTREPFFLGVFVFPGLVLAYAATGHAATDERASVA